MGNFGDLPKGEVELGMLLAWEWWNKFIWSESHPFGEVIASQSVLQWFPPFPPSTTPALLTEGPSGAGLKVVSNRNMPHRTHQKCTYGMESGKETRFKV